MFKKKYIYIHTYTKKKSYVIHTPCHQLKPSAKEIDQQEKQTSFAQGQSAGWSHVII